MIAWTPVNKKNEGKIKKVGVSKLAHRRLKFLSWKRDVSIESLVDKAIWDFLKAER